MLLDFPILGGRGPRAPGRTPSGRPARAAGPGRGARGAGGPGWAGTGPRLCLHRARGSGARGSGAQRCAARGAGQPLGRPGPSGRRPLRAPRRGAALGWAPTRPRCRRGRPWLLSSAAHARCCAPSRRRPCAPRLPPPASRPHRRARGGPGAATQRPAPPPAPHPPGRACARGSAGPQRGAPGLLGPRAGGRGHPRRLPRCDTRRSGPPRPSPRAEPGGGGPGRADVNEAESLPGEIHSFDTDLLGTPRTRTGSVPALTGRGRERGGHGSAECHMWWWGAPPAPGKVTSKPRGEGGVAGNAFQNQKTWRKEG